MAGLFDTGANALLGMGQGTVRPQTNQLQNIAAAQGIQNQALEYQNALLGQKARKAVGNALARHVRKDGSIDYGSAIADAASDPDAAYGLPDAVTQNNSQQAQNIGNQGAQLELNQRKAGMLAGLAAPLMSNPNVTKGDVARQLGVGVAHGLISMDQAQAAYSALPDDSSGIRQQVRGLMDASIGPAHAYNDAYGSMQLVDDGGTLHWQNVGSPASGQGGQNVGGGIAKQTSPETNSAPIDVINPDGSHSILRRDQVVGGAQGRPTVPPEVMGSGRYPTAQPANPGYQSSPAAGQTAALTETAQAGAQGANALMQASANRNDRMAALGNMSSDLEGFTSGPGSERIRHFASVFDNWTGGNWKSGEIENAQSFNKWAQNLANAQSQALGTGTDSKLAAAVHASPNSALQGSTNRLMIHQLMGNEDAINAKAQAWQKAGLQPAQFQQWNQQFSQSFDPRAYQLLRMTPDERKTVFQGMKKSGQIEEFKKNYNAMAAAGLVPSGER